MGLLSSLILLLVLVTTLFYLRIKLLPATLVVAAALASWTFLAMSSTGTLIILWALFLPPALFFNLTSIRRTWASNSIFKIFKQVVPSMSSTEQEALEAGSVWWDADLFSGAPNWKRLLGTRKNQLSAEEQAFLDGPVEELCKMITDWEITEERRDLPPEAWQFIKDNGFFGMIIPKKYGGLEFSAYAHSCVVVKLASRSITAAVTVMVPNSLGPAELLHRYGTQEQKDYYLPRLAKGVEVPCFALTGPEAGSDAGNMPDKGVVCKGEFEGKEVLGIKLNWEKRYITLGPVATVLGLAFKLYDPDHLLGEKEDLGITLALIPTDTPGVTIGSRHVPLNIGFQNGPNWGKDVFIPMDWIIGGADYIGAGWKMLVECLAVGRAISLPALSTGAGKFASRATGAYARIRKQFKMPIGKFEGVEEHLTQIAGYTYVMDAARNLALAGVDEGQQPSVISAILKYNLTEYMRKVVNSAMDVQGGSGICLGPRNLLGRVYQAVPISITVEGANILTRSLIIFGQGAVRCHPFVYKEMQAINNKDESEGLVDFDKAIFGHIGLTISNMIRTLVLGLTGGRVAGAPHDNYLVRRYVKQFTRMSAAFAFLADVSMLLLGGALKRKEKLSGRFADVLSQLYLGSSVIKHFVDNGCQSEEAYLMRWSCEQSLFEMQRAMLGILRNYPNRFIGKVLEFMVFPLGKSYKNSSDFLGHKVAQTILEPSALRDRLTSGLYIPQNTEEALGLLEDTLEKVVSTESIEDKIRYAVRNKEIPRCEDEFEQLEVARKERVIDDVEARNLKDAIEARREAVKVDDFTVEYLLKEKEHPWPNKTAAPEAAVKQSI